MASLRASRGRTIGVAPQRLGHLAPDRVHRIERGHRLLEDHADAIATQLAVIRIRQAYQLAAVEPDAAADDGALGQQAHQRERSDGLAAAGFADETQGFAALQREADPANSLRGPAAGVEPDAEVLDFDQRRVGGPAHAQRSRASRGSSRSRNPSPSRLRPSTATAIAAPG